MEIPDYLSCLLRNLYVGQESTVRTRHGTMDWFQIGKGGLALHLLKNFPPFVLIHTAHGFSLINVEEMDVFMEFSWFSSDLMDVGNLISASSAFSKLSLNIWNQHLGSPTIEA